jgi:hypothetical protein
MKFTYQKYLLIPIIYLLGCATAYADDKGACNGGDLDAKGNCVSMWDAYDWPESYFDSKLDKVAYDCNGTGWGNCLAHSRCVAKKMKELYNLNTELFYISSLGEVGHVVACYQNQCVDNGTLSSGLFAQEDLDHYQYAKMFKVKEEYYVFNEDKSIAQVQMLIGQTK